MGRALLVVVVVLGMALAVPRAAHACFEVNYEEHQRDAMILGDTTPPGAATASARIERIEDQGCASRCGGDDHNVVLSLAATDDLAPPDKLGFRMRVVEGTAPKPVPTVDVVGGEDSVYLDFGDAAGFAYTLEIRAVDLNGNVGPPMLLRVVDPDDGGCVTHRSAGPGALGLVALALAAALQRRRRRA